MLARPRLKVGLRRSRESACSPAKQHLGFRRQPRACRASRYFRGAPQRDFWPHRSQTLPEKAVRVGQSYFVEYLNREEPSDEGFAERKETLRDQALSSKRQRVVQDWLKSARDAAAVEVNPLVLASGN